MMRSITIWTAIGIFSLTAFGIGLAMGRRTESVIDAVYCLQKDWQGLLGALASILAAGATIQAGRWALKGIQRQIENTNRADEIRRERLVKGVKSRILLDLNHLSKYCRDSIVYIYNIDKAMSTPCVDKAAVDNLKYLIEFGSDEISSEATRLFSEIQLADAWVSSLLLERETVINARAECALQCLILSALCDRWYPYARKELDDVDGDVSEKNVRSTLSIIQSTCGDALDIEDDEIDLLNSCIELKFKKRTPATASPGSPS